MREVTDSSPIPKKRLGIIRDEHLTLASLLLAGLAVRLWLVPKGAYLPDAVQFKIWGEQLASTSLASFYRMADPPTDYLPGYLYLLAATEHLRAQIDGPISMLGAYIPWLKAAPIVADMVVGAGVYLLGRRFASSRRSLVATALVIFNPGVIFVSAVWGQVDSVGFAPAMLSLVALVNGNPIPAAILGGVAFVVKPQYSLFLAVAGISYLRAESLRLPPLNTLDAKGVWGRWVLWRLALPIVALVATLQLLLLPLSVSLWPGPNVAWTLRS